MIIKEIKNKREYLPLLLLADEQESMIDLYLDRGTMFVLEESGSVKAECVVTDEGNGMLEIQNLAVCILRRPAASDAELNGRDAVCQRPAGLRY